MSEDKKEKETIHPEEETMCLEKETATDAEKLETSSVSLEEASNNLLPKLCFFNSFFSVSSTKLWNSLPTEIV